MELRKNDFGYYVNFTVYQADGVTPRDLTSIDIVRFVVRESSTNRNIVTGNCIVVVAASGTCKYLVLEDDFIIDGVFKAGLQLIIGTEDSITNLETSSDFSLVVKKALK